MFEYYLIGKVYKETYEIYLTSYYSIVNDAMLCGNRTSYDLNTLKTDNIMSCLKEAVNYKCDYESKFYKYDDESDYKEKHKLQKQLIYNVDVFDRCEEFDYIETDREFRDNETVKIDGQDYAIQYKYNKELRRHELYLDYTIKTEIDEVLKKNCEDKIFELNKQIDEYNKLIDMSEVIVDRKFRNYIQLKDKPTPPLVKVVYEDGGILNKIKNWFKGGK